ncbi:MAG: hypothetical protein LBV75_07565, partial [Paludibacter sp.]|nr:hypothetical protein [Paludibacter sp.]
DTSGISGAQGSEFFSNFNYNGMLTSLPAGSFDTSGITGTQGSLFFAYFNYSKGKIPLDTTSLNRIKISNNTPTQITFHYWNGSASVAVIVTAGGTFDGYPAG